MKRKFKNLTTKFTARTFQTRHTNWNIPNLVNKFPRSFSLYGRRAYEFKPSEWENLYLWITHTRMWSSSDSICRMYRRRMMNVGLMNFLSFLCIYSLFFWDFHSLFFLVLFSRTHNRCLWVEAKKSSITCCL